MAWSIQDFGAMGELVSAIAVMLTLLYLTLQIRQSNRQARLSSIQAVNASNDSAFDPIYIPENTRIWTTGLEDPDALDPAEWRIFGLLMTRLVASFDTTTYQYEQKAYDAAMYEPMAGFYGEMVSTPGGRR